MEKQLSIIIPHYNSLQLLKRLLASIPVKEEIQVIAVDDKSNIDAKEWEALAGEFPYVELYWNETDEKGAGVCRNIGLEHAVGKWLLFADADDYFVDNFYTYTADYFSSENDIVFFMPTSVYEENGEPAERHLFYKKLIRNYILDYSHRNELLLRYEHEAPWAKLIRRSVVCENNILFEAVRYSNDIMFSMKVARHAKKIAVDKNILYVITKSKNTLTTTINPDSAKIRLNVFLRKIQYLKEQLSKKDFRLLNINGLGWILYVIRNRMGVGMFLYCIRLFHKNGVPVMNYRMFTLSYWLEKIRAIKNNKIEL